ncbi:MAG: hypothetical protein LDL31_05635, partial [Prosthecobacter sp.]|nr:hypothetical protein [Prosthecobacter sp.]
MSDYQPILPRFCGPWAAALQFLACFSLIFHPLPLSSTWVDTDADGILDSWQPNHSGPIFTLLDLDAQSTDIDGDNATNEEERLYGSDPFVYDTDGDGLSDGDEIHLAIQQAGKAYSLTAWDSNGDGVSDFDDFHNFFAVTYPNSQLPDFPGTSY